MISSTKRLIEGTEDGDDLSFTDKDSGNGDVFRSKANVLKVILLYVVKAIRDSVPFLYNKARTTLEPTEE